MVADGDDTDAMEKSEGRWSEDVAHERMTGKDEDTSLRVSASGIPAPTSSLARMANAASKAAAASLLLQGGRVDVR